MTISSQTRKAGPFVGNDSSTAFPFAFKVFQASDLLVVRANSAGVESVLVLNTDYTVTLNADQNSNPGGTVTLGSALATGYSLVLTSSLQYLQPTDLTNQGGFYPKVITDALDRATIQIQQLAEEVGRSAKLPITNTGDAEALTADLVRLADSADNIDTVADNIADVNTVADDIADVSTVAGIAANVTTVAGIAANVTTVAGNTTNIDAVAAIDDDVTTVAGIAADVSAVADIAADVTTAADNIAAIVDAPNQASAAASSASAAAGSASAAATSASSAASSAAAAAAALDNFDDRYLGAKASDPATDNDGNPLVQGALYYNTTTYKMRVYEGSGWIDASSASIATMNVYEFVATAGQTTFTGVDANGNTLSYLAPALIVTLNGSVLRPGDEYTATNGTSVALASGATASDELVVIAFGNFVVADIDGQDVSFTQAGTGAVERTVTSKLRERLSVKDFGAVGDGVADDTAAIQAAITAGGQNATIYYPEGTYKITASITLQPQQNHVGDGAVFAVASGVSAFIRTTDGFPGRIKFSGFRFEGTSYTGKGIAITNNTPFVQIENCYFTGFLEGVRLDGSYCSNIKDSYFSYNRFGALLINETHSSSLINCFFDGNTYTGLGINGESSGGNLGSNAIHNVTTVGCAFQNSEFGVWAEECYELHLINTYHEGNSKADLRLGVGDGGAYGRYCYNFTVDGWQSSSPCASGKNIIIEHAVAGNLRGLAFNGGTSTTATVLEADAYSDRIDIDYHRVGHASFTATAPFNVPAGRVIIGNSGRKILPWGLQAFKFGSPGSTPGSIYGGYTPGSYRPTLQFDSLGSNQDMSFKVQDLERHYDSADNLRYYIDHLNGRIKHGYTTSPISDNTLAMGEAGSRWSVIYAGTGTINTSDEREKQDIEAIPQEWLNAWADVQYTRFKFKDAVAQKGAGARWHVGLIAQRVQEVFEARGLDPFAIGLLCLDRWDESTDADGNVTPAGERFGVRYEQALALECAYLRSKLTM